MQACPFINLDSGSSTPFLTRSSSREGRGAGPFARSPCMGRGLILSRWDQAYCTTLKRCSHQVQEVFSAVIGCPTGHGCISWALFEVCCKVAGQGHRLLVDRKKVGVWSRQSIFVHQHLMLPFGLDVIAHRSGQFEPAMSFGSR